MTYSMAGDDLMDKNEPGKGDGEHRGVVFVMLSGVVKDCLKEVMEPAMHISGGRMFQAEEEQRPGGGSVLEPPCFPGALELLLM